MSTIERAIAFAADAHAGQVDKGGEPYILHPLRVMLAMTTDAQRIVAVLHDVVEDTDLTFECLAARGFRDHVEALDHLTKRAQETYTGFVERCADHPIAKVVKVADIRDNLSPARMARLQPAERDSKGDRYRRALFRLGAGPNPDACLPETHVNGAVSPLTNAVAGFITDAKNTIAYRDAVRVAERIIPLVREADIRAGVRP